MRAGALRKCGGGDRPLQPVQLSSEFQQDALGGKARFKQHLRKVGSGEHTSKGLSRDEARDALALMLTGQASPAQIGAFLIAHRIRRPEPQELAGMLDYYREQGPAISSLKPAICFGMPYDGRTRTAAVFPLTALVLASADIPVVLQGGARMPIKYGITPLELFGLLGIRLKGQSLAQLQASLDQHQLALAHQPDHFPAADNLTSYREELGKRPPIASLELLWTPHRGEHVLVSGFVHPPTESRCWKALGLAGETNIVTIKGLEGSTDIPTSRAGISSHVRNGSPERVILHPRDHGCFGSDVIWSGEEAWQVMAEAALRGMGDLARAVVWNAGCYLWFLDPAQELGNCLLRVKDLLRSGAVLAKREQLRSWSANIGTPTPALPDACLSAG